MKIYSVIFSENAKKQLKKLDKHISSLIIAWLEKNVHGTTNPRQHGKSLTANRTGQWRYRVGNYRIIADIQDKKILVLIIEIGHRKNIYTN